MSMEEPTRPTTCDHCGEAFNTSAVHPSRYCSIACEEGRAPRAIDDPASDGYHLHLQGNPQALVGREVLAVGLKRTDYSPDWHKKPSQYSPRRIVEHQESDTTLVLKDEVFLGRVVDLTDGIYQIRHEHMETGEEFHISVDASTVVSQIRQDRWWVA